MSNEVLTMVGGVITFLLGVNAWYFKGIVTGIQKIEIRLEKVVTEKDFMDRMLLNHDDEIRKLRDKVHTLEGRDAQMLKWIEEHEG